jgi:succinate dehydrogenase/fumarate reductase flavoprotein subunit
MPPIRESKGNDADGTFDVALVGATAGSLFAAIKLADAGLRPLVLEKSTWIGGGTAYSGGILWAPDNHRMRAKGLADSADEALEYIAGISEGRADLADARAYVQHVGRVLLDVEACTTLKWVTYTGLPDYWAERAGGKPQGRFLLPLEWVPTTLGAHAARVRRLLSLPGQENAWVWGRAVIGALYEAALCRNISVLTERRAVGLVSENGQVCGVRMRSAGQSERDVQTPRGVLLNTGGFEWNSEWTTRYIGGPRPKPLTPPANEGDGHAMLADLGVPLTLMDRTIAIPGIRVPDSANDGQPLWRVFFQPLARPHSLVVNTSGRRFGDESFFVSLADAMQKSSSAESAPNTPAYFIWDAEYERRYGTPGGVTRSMLTEGATLRDLARSCGIAAAGLVDEVATFNALVRSRSRDPFGRGESAYARNLGDPAYAANPNLGVVEVPPFRALPIELTTAGHRGGAATDDRGRVLDRVGRPVPGLYACGNVAAGVVTGQQYFSGASLGQALVFAALAAEDMLARC